MSYTIKTQDDFSLEKKVKDIKKINKIESLLNRYLKSIWDGYYSVTDTQYNSVLDYLNTLSSQYLGTKLINFEYRNINNFIHSIVNIQDYLSLYSIVSIKGLPISLSYKDGCLISAVTKGKSFEGIDITHEMKLLLGEENDNLAELGYIVVEGVLAIPLNYTEYIKEITGYFDTYLGIFSLLNNEELMLNDLDLLNFICYDVSLDLETLSLEEKYDYIAEYYGFAVPNVICVNKEESTSIIDLLNEISFNYEMSITGYDYMSDGYIIHYNNEYIKIIRGFFEQPSVVTIDRIDWVTEYNLYKPILHFEKPIQLSINKELDMLIIDNIRDLLYLDIKEGKSYNIIILGDIGVIFIIEDKNIFIPIMHFK